MCTYIVEKTGVLGSGKGAQGWFSLNQAVVGFDHPAHAPFDHAVLIDFVDDTGGPSARVAVELSTESARGLVKAIQAAIDAAEAEHVVDGAPALAAQR
jgi:hypothetical protein